nr:cytochrome P450 [uncultured Gellertiella sp.]
MTWAETITIGELEADPYPFYAHLRREQPVAHVPAANVWFATRWPDVEAVTKSPDLFSAEAPTSPVEISFGRPTILTVDGGVHRELRGGIEPHYRPKQVQSWVEPLVRPLAEAQLARLEGRDSAELMADYFEPVSVLSLARSFGFHDVDVDTLRHWFHGLSQGAINYECDPARQAICDAVCGEIDAALVPLLEARLTSPDASPLSALLHHGREPGNPRSPEMVLPTIKVTLLGGMQEPGHGAGSVLAGLLGEPAQFSELLAAPETLLARAVEEGLRWVAPIGTQMRIATRDVELGGVVIPKGAPVAAILASANRDEQRFADPDRFDIHRDRPSIATFGFGGHFCAGKWFAKAQIEIMLSVLLARYPSLTLDPSLPPVFGGWEFRAPQHLHVLLR